MAAIFFSGPSLHMAYGIDALKYNDLHNLIEKFTSQPLMEFYQHIQPDCQVQILCETGNIYIDDCGAS